MAADWIKMRIDLQTHPKVVRILSATMADKFRVIGGLHAVWAIFDTHSVDGVLNGYSPSILDHLIGWDGFSQAMIDVKWLSFDGENLTVPEFEEHNGASGKRRAEDQKRKKKSRDRPNYVRKMSADVSANPPDKLRTRGEIEDIDQEQELPSLPPKATKTKVTPVPVGFVEFWQSYPRKEGKGAAIKAYAKTTEAERRVIANVLPQFAGSWKWINEPQYIPYPQKWLNERRWEDQPPMAGPGRSAKADPPSRQARQLQAIEDVINDPRYAATAQRQLASDRHRPGPSAPHDAELALDTGPGCAAWDHDGVD